MKLLNKITLYYISSLILILSLGVYVQYLYVSYKVEKRVQKTLIKEKKLLVKQILDKEKAEGFKLYKTEESKVVLSTEEGIKKNSFIKQFFYDEDEDEYINYLVLRCRVEANDNFYNIVVKKPLLQAQDLISSIVLSSLISLMVLFLIYLLINRFISKRIFSPFYRTLELLREYNLETGDEIRFDEDSTTREFSFLNHELNALTDKISQYFTNQKQFSDNAAHELQTPLAIIKMNAELLLQAGNIQGEDIKKIDAIQQAIDRIARLNKALVVLSKIEQHDFTTDEQINLVDTIKEILESFDFLIEDMELELSVNLEESFEIRMDKELAFIFLTNLIRNAIKHNIKGGWLSLKVLNGKIEIANFGHELESNSNEYFKRFVKGGKTGSSGLGLSIVNEICLKSGLKLDYKTIKREHSITLQKLS